MLIVADTFTKWVEAFPIPDILAVKVVWALVREVVCCFSTPRSFHSDQGCTFDTQVVKDFAHLLGWTKPGPPLITP